MAVCLSGCVQHAGYSLHGTGQAGMHINMWACTRVQHACAHTRWGLRLFSCHSPTLSTMMYVKGEGELASRSSSDVSMPSACSSLHRHNTQHASGLRAAHACHTSTVMAFTYTERCCSQQKQPAPSVRHRTAPPTTAVCPKHSKNNNKLLCTQRGNKFACVPHIHCSAHGLARWEPADSKTGACGLPCCASWGTPTTEAVAACEIRV